MCKLFSFSHDHIETESGRTIRGHSATSLMCVTHAGFCYPLTIMKGRSRLRASGGVVSWVLPREWSTPGVAAIWDMQSLL
jgi:hypothetical protein